VDVGCAIGVWLAEFAKHGIDDFLGIDGDYIDRSRLVIPKDRFVGYDLSQPLNLDRRFDLAVSLEVAEHLPPDTAACFVNSLTRLAAVVLFSAAVPGQGGTGHVNEQWPEYWTSLFREAGYRPIDAIRHRVWDNDGVAWWYAQNTLLFVRAAAPEPDCSRLPLDASGNPLALIHPSFYALSIDGERDLTARELVRRLPAALYDACRSRLSLD